MLFKFRLMTWRAVRKYPLFRASSAVPVKSIRPPRAATASTVRGAFAFAASRGVSVMVYMTPL